MRVRGRDKPEAVEFDHIAAPIFQFIDTLRNSGGQSEKELLGRAAAHLARFEDEALASGAIRPSVRPARFALAVLIDDAARRNSNLDINVWASAAHRVLFDGRDMSLDTVRVFLRTAQAGGDDYRALVLFLETVIERAEQTRHAGYNRRILSSWGKISIFSIIAFVLAVSSYAVFLEYRYHAALDRIFQAEMRAINLDDVTTGPDLIAAFDQIKNSVERVGRAAADAPLGRYFSVPYLNSGNTAEVYYQDAVTTRVPAMLAVEMDEVLATQGDGLVLYDTLRAWSILEGRADWSVAYLAGWARDHTPVAGLAVHIPAINANPRLALPSLDPELLAQSREFAAQVDEPARAWLELIRASEVAKLPGWVAGDAVPGLDQVLLRRSGRDIDAPVPGIFTANGWIYARDFGAGIAVQKSRAVAQALLGENLKIQNESPDLLMDRLQSETVQYWQAWLADIRVQPFRDASSSVLISGRLAAGSSPLTVLLQEVWQQVGGLDRSRNHADQLRLAATFGPMIQFVEQGGMKSISSLFAALNVALGSVDVDQDRGVERLMSVQDRANSISALQQAPAIVVQIVEDVLAQTAAVHAGLQSNPLNRRWQSDVYPVCHAAIDGHYPFDPGGPDTGLADFVRALSPDGAIVGFVNTQALRFLDTTATPWRWKPEARLAGLSPETAIFFQQALAISEAFFTPDGQLGRDMTLAVLAEKGQGFMQLGGDGVSLRASGTEEVLNWPGPVPETGAEVSFRENDASARLTEPGAWGLFHLLDAMRVRSRNQGERFLVDMRAPQGRLFVEVIFNNRNNPVSGRRLLTGFSCPPVL